MLTGFMKFTTDQIKQELAALEQSEAVAAPYYLKKELARRKASERNSGAPVRFEDDQHKRQREASRRYRDKKVQELGGKPS